MFLVSNLGEIALFFAGGIVGWFFHKWFGKK